MYDSDCSDNNNDSFYPSHSSREELIAHLQGAAAQRTAQNAATQFDDMATATAAELATIRMIQAINDATNGGGYPPPSPGAIAAEALANKKGMCRLLWCGCHLTLV